MTKTVGVSASYNLHISHLIDVDSRIEQQSTKKVNLHRTKRPILVVLLKLNTFYEPFFYLSLLSDPLRENLLYNLWRVTASRADCF